MDPNARAAGLAPWPMTMARVSAPKWLLSKRTKPVSITYNMVVAQLPTIYETNDWARGPARLALLKKVPEKLVEALVAARDDYRGRSRNSPPPRIEPGADGVRDRRRRLQGAQFTVQFELLVVSLVMVVFALKLAFQDTLISSTQAQPDWPPVPSMTEMNLYFHSAFSPMSSFFLVGVVPPDDAPIEVVDLDQSAVGGGGVIVRAIERIGRRRGGLKADLLLQSDLVVDAGGALIGPIVG